MTSLNSSRLVRCLSELGVAEVDSSHRQFAQRLGRLVDLSDSVTISRVQGRSLADTFEQKTYNNAAIQADFLKVRNAIVGSIVDSFGSSAELRRIKLPPAKEQAPQDGAEGFEPYGRFYAAHQREMAGQIAQLQGRVRASVAGASVELAQLATLDKVLGDTLASHSRKCFAVIPGLLRKRFEQLLEQYCQASANPQAHSGTWPEMLELFTRQMRELLLAEVEARLLPSQGLIEALNSEFEKDKL